MVVDRRNVLGGSVWMLTGGLALWAWPGRAASPPDPWNLPDAEWRRRLAPAAYAILRQGSTEAPGSSPLLREHRRGTFTCAGCEWPLFSSTTKFDSGTGWPSFWRPLPGGVTLRRDTTYGMVRDEVRCHRCAGHLGHVFDDGPPPTGQRYCMNGAALHFHVEAKV